MLPIQSSSIENQYDRDVVARQRFSGCSIASRQASQQHPSLPSLPALKLPWAQGSESAGPRCVPMTDVRQAGGNDSHVVMATGSPHSQASGPLLPSPATHSWQGGPFAQPAPHPSQPQPLPKATFPNRVQRRESSSSQSTRNSSTSTSPRPFRRTSSSSSSSSSPTNSIPGTAVAHGAIVRKTQQKADKNAREKLNRMKNGQGLQSIEALLTRHGTRFRTQLSKYNRGFHTGYTKNEVLSATNFALGLLLETHHDVGGVVGSVNGYLAREFGKGKVGGGGGATSATSVEGEVGRGGETAGHVQGGVLGGAAAAAAARLEAYPTPDASPSPTPMVSRARL